MTPTVAAYRELHRSGCFVQPNPWDVGSAVFLASLGFKALATSSAGFAYTRGKTDDMAALPVEEVLAHCRELAQATPLPVHADFQGGYADEPEEVARNVTRCVETGVAGLSIEDNSGERLYEHELAVERVRAARAAIDASGTAALLTARCEAWLVRHPEPFETALDRLVAFAEAGADCLFAPGVRKEVEIATMVAAVAPKPVNVIVTMPGTGLTIARLAELGVRRISVGPALARVAWGAFMRAARSLVETGSFEGMTGQATNAELDTLFRVKGA